MQETALRRAIDVRPHGQWPEDQRRADITLAYADRHRRRLRLADDAGEDFLLDLPHAALLAEGDGLALEGGGFIRVRAAEEEVAEVRCDQAEDLARLAWHIGNRHMPVQVITGGLRLPWDHVLVAMLTGLGARVEHRRAAFQPEGGAYAQGQPHDHGHGHDHDRGAPHEHG